MNACKLFFAMLLFLGMNGALFSQEEHPSSEMEETRIILVKKKTDEDGKTIIKKIITTGEGDEQVIVEESDEDGIIILDGDAEEDIEIRVHRDSVPRYRLRILKDGKPLEFEWEGAAAYPEEVEEYFEQLEDRFEGKGPFAFFGASRAFLGIRMEYDEEVEIEDGTAERHSEGVRIEDVIEGSPAEKAGLQAGDLLLALDGQPVHNPSEVGDYILTKKPGDQVTITYLREGRQAETTVTLADSKKFSHGVFFYHDDDGDFDFDFDFDGGEGHSDEEGFFRQNLELKTFEASPNPTRGVLKVRFEAEPTPTVLTLTDPSGRFHYRQVIKNFDGSYDGEINLEGAPKGVLYLTIRQGNRSFTEGVVYQ